MPSGSDVIVKGGSDVIVKGGQCRHSKEICDLTYVTNNLCSVTSLQVEELTNLLHASDILLKKTRAVRGTLRAPEPLFHPTLPVF